MIRSVNNIKRILGGFLLLAVAFAPVTHAAGLGKLTVSSALGQPLLAEIEIVSLQPGEFESITARVASPDAYRDARIEYGSALRQIRFAVDRRANGQAILKLTSVSPVNEPFLDVLVEITWPAGRLVREYPILLDPPGFNEAKAPVAPAPAAASTAAPSSPQVATVAPPKAVEPTKPSVSASAPAVPAKAAAPAASPADTYGPVKKGDTLNKIASEMKSESVSLEQMLVALYRENQSAFIDNNMNRLKTGQILRVPAASDVARITNTEAKKEIRVQVENWKTYRDSVASSVASSPAASAAPANQASGKIATAKPDAPAGAPTKDVLKLSKADAVSGKAGAAGAKGGTADQVNALREEAIAREGALKEAKSRVADLEKQITDMRKLMELKGISPPGKPGDPKAVAKPEEKKAPEAPKPADTKVAQVTPAKPAEAAKPVEPPKVDPKAAAAKPAEPAKVADAGKAAEPSKDAKPADAKPAEAAKPADAKPAEAAKPAAPAKPKVAAAPPEPSIADTIMENLPFIGGGIGALVLGVGGFLFMRKRKAKSGGHTGGPFTSGASSILPSDLKPPTTTSGKAAGGLIDTGNSSFLTDFDKQGPGTIDTDEVDPVAEAEVYIAYGRDAQAEEILKEAMGRDKSRHEITLKLLEIYHTRKSTQAFETLAREFKDTAGETSPVWARAAAMGAQLDPSNPLYAGFAAQDFGSTAAMAATPAAAGGDAGKGNPPDLDFDLGFSSSAKPSVDISLDTPSTQPDMDMGFDLNLSGPDSAAPVEAPAADAGGGLDFDLGLDKPSAPAASAAEPAKSDGGGFDFDLSSLSLDVPADAPKAAEPSANEKTAAFNIGDINLDLDSPSSAPSTAPAGGGDASSTKLELARAYVEIGDKDGAKEILQEVLREGSDAQKQEAQSLINSL